MLDYYPLLIKSAIDLKIESRKILAKHNGKYFNLKAEICKIPE